MPIYISEDAFITLTLSAIETSTKYEAAGLLLGYETGKTYYLQNVIPYQIAERTSSSVDVSRKRQNRMRRVFKNYLKYSIIGEFHTHPDGSVKLSKEDKKVIKDSGYELEIVVALIKEESEKEKSDGRWRYKKKKLSGSIDKYFIEIGCWELRKGKIHRLGIRCPFAVGFGDKPLKLH